MKMTARWRRCYQSVSTRSEPESTAMITSAVSRPLIVIDVICRELLTVAVRHRIP